MILHLLKLRQNILDWINRMEKISILDCTLRDGGRIIDCKFHNDDILDISQELSDSGIEIVELGFLRDSKLVKYKGNSTFFTDIRQIDEFATNPKKTLYCAFIDYGMFDFEELDVWNGSGVRGIRVGFTKKNFDTERKELIDALVSVKEKGYELFIQSVNSPGYTDRELLDIIDIVNDIEPYSFGIVDTYGTLYLEDFTHIYDLVEHNLKKNICIDIHSHNNFQSSFAFAQEVLRISGKSRKIILDSTLNGMGKCAGNLNTEIIVDYLNRKWDKQYNLDKILDCIDRQLMPIKEKIFWGYSIPAFMAGIYRSHPNNVIYLTDKYRLGSKDIQYILSKIDTEKRQRYDYDNIQRIYREYISVTVDDAETISRLSNDFSGKCVLVIAPGNTVRIYNDRLEKEAKRRDTVVISVNFLPDSIAVDYLFCANPIHWGRIRKKFERGKCILTSNIKENTDGAYYINYSSYLDDRSTLADNSTMMLLRFLYVCRVNKIMLAGFDGMKESGENYATDGFVNTGHGMSASDNNRIIKEMYHAYKKQVGDSVDISFLTPSIYNEEYDVK